MVYNVDLKLKVHQPHAIDSNQFDLMRFRSA